MPGQGRGAERRTAARSAAVALAGAFRPGAMVRRGDWGGWLRACLAEEIEQRRLFPWLAVSFGLGVLLYFAAEGRPALWAPLATAAIAAGVAVLARGRPIGFAVALGFTALFCGFSAGVWRERWVETPVLGRVTVGPISGFVEIVEERVRGGRIVIRPSELAGLAAERRPARAATTSRATPTSTASAPSARSPARSRCARPPPRRRSISR